ncbi:GcvT family protein [Aestuariibius sp. 2305UL40-4]|uniref:GcvT family protein n=1 Tax=Aestuariibius violaceus TaxID=3234132 RepID=UPI00345E2851
MREVPGAARAVVIGGGVSGCSVAYHLADLGWDVVLLERRRLTCGTTWHAAGLIGQLRSNANMTRLARYSADLYARLEDETGIGTGMRRTGSLSLALTEHRLTEIRRQAGLARAFGVEAHEITAADVAGLHPHVEIGDVLGAVHLPGDGQCDPAGVAMALAKGARMRGASIMEGVSATDVLTEDGRVTGVTWVRDGETDTIACEHVVNCGGMWGRELAARAGVTLPLHACEHFYLVTEPIADLDRLPVLRVPDECAYYKEDAGKILLGAFERVAKPWGGAGIPENFEFDSLAEDFEHFEPILQTAIARMPMLKEAGIRTFFNGPESFTPDDRYYLGEAPELRGYWVAAGYNSIGIVSSGGAGRALAAWMDDGLPPHDLWDVDIRRAQPFQRSRHYLGERVSETLGLLYADHWPFRQPETARGVRRTPLHDTLKARGAVFGEAAGWERANWFARDGQEREYCHDWHRANWFENRAVEHMACREDAGLFDLSTFGKIRVEGRDACHFLNRVCAGEVDVAPGRIVYTQMLNARGGIECDLTVTRLSETAFLCVVPAATVRRDLAWLTRHVGDDFAVITDVTSGEGVIAVMGPRAREVLMAAGAGDLSNEGHPFGTAREVEIGLTLARAHRVSYVGELGWELYLPTDQVAHAFEAIMGVDAPPKLCGLHALDSLRCEKAFRHFGHDITDEDHVLEAGLGFAVRTSKGDFIGRDAVLRRREAGLTRRMVQFLLDDPDPILHHDETILRNGEPVSILTSGSYGHALGAAVGLGYVPCAGETSADVLANSYEIEIAGTRVPASISLRPLYDPSGARMRS